jgi:hypothetical protein
MGVIQFEDWADTGEEYTAFELGNEVADPNASHGVNPGLAAG